jgi:hypothetical protein
MMPNASGSGVLVNPIGKPQPKRYSNVKYINPGYVVNVALRATQVNGAQFFVNSEKIEKDVNDLVDEAVAFAEASPEPPLSELLTDIFKEH